MNIGDMRKAYNDDRVTFDIGDLAAKEPFKNFDDWFNVARQSEKIEEANAMTVATATRDGRPSARVLLLKGYSKEDGFVFYTNYGSRKAQELETNPQVALLFYWDALHRSVRIEGRVERVSEAVSTQYFQSRPKDSQIGSSASRQSSVIAGRHVLDEKKKELEMKYADQEVLPRPEFWGGYRVIPEYFEFWQGQTNRIHDRVIFRRPKSEETVDEALTHPGDEGWLIERLSP